MFDEAGGTVDNLDQAVYIIDREFCPCEAGQQAKQRHEQVKARQDWLDKARLLIQQLDIGKYDQYRFKTWDPQRYAGADRVYEEIFTYVDHIIHKRTRKWLFMYGYYGLGKTHLAVSALRKIAAENLWEPMAVVWPAHCSQVKESWSKDSKAGPSERQLWGRMRACTVLLLDDIDKMESSKWTLQKLYEVIDYRVNKQKVTIITANHSLLQLRDLWADSKEDHIRDIGSAILTRIAGELYQAVEFPKDAEDQRWT